MLLFFDVEQGKPTDSKTGQGDADQKSGLPDNSLYTTSREYPIHIYSSDGSHIGTGEDQFAGRLRVVSVRGGARLLGDASKSKPLHHGSKNGMRD